MKLKYNYKNKSLNTVDNSHKNLRDLSYEADVWAHIHVINISGQLRYYTVGSFPNEKKEEMYLILKASVHAETGVLSVIYERTKKKLFYYSDPVPSQELYFSLPNTTVFTLPNQKLN
jgi:hypothetical protein